tara:strand:- start:435 stop:893 length:459 start_codon:yes stop_codon:yes gene_type:complete
MKRFSDFRGDQAEVLWESYIGTLSEEEVESINNSILELLSEEDLSELTGDTTGTGVTGAVVGGLARAGKAVLWDAPKFVIKKGLKVMNSRPARAIYAADSAKETYKSVKNKEPWWQTGSKALTGYWAKKTGGFKRAITGELGSALLPGNKAQ